MRQWEKHLDKSYLVFVVVDAYTTPTRAGLET